MKCYCYEEGNTFYWCVENVPEKQHNNIVSAGFDKRGDKYYREYPNTIVEKEIIAKNFPRLGESYFLNTGRWQESMLTFITKCAAEDITWYTTGSISEALTGVDINPGDIDIIAHTDDFFKMRDVFSEYIIEPFFDNHQEWILRYFARLCINGCKVEIAADTSRNAENHVYSPILWNGYPVNVEPLQDRYEIELQRKRTDRIKAIEAFMKQQKVDSE